MIKYSDNVKIFFIITVGFLLSLWLFQYVNKNSRDEFTHRFVVDTNERFLSIEKNIIEEINVMHAIVGLFESSEVVNRKEFTSFIKTITNDRKVGSFQALEWVPKVLLEQRYEYKNEAIKNGFVDFEIQERNKDGKLIKAKKRKEYYPVYYVEPYKGNELALGFDLASNASRRAVLAKARDTGLMVSSGKINLIQLKSDRAGILTFFPVYLKGKPHKTIEQRQKNIMGFSLGVIKVKTLVWSEMKSSFSTQYDRKIDYYVYDQEESKEPLYVHYFNNEKDDNTLLSLKDNRKGYHLEHVINMGDRQWSVIARPHNVDIAYSIPTQNWIMFISFLLVTLLLSAYIFILSKRTSSITARDKAEHALTLSESRLNEAQRIAKMGSWELDLLSGNLIWSDEIFYIFDIDKNKFEASYDAFLNAIHPEDRDSVNAAYTNSLETRQGYEIVHRLKMKNGIIKHVRETCKSFFDDENKPIRSVGIVQDITEIVIAETELTKYRENLEELIEERTYQLKGTQEELVRKERLATLGQLTATVSHELRNPLGAMRPSLYVIEKRSDKEDERLQQAITRVDRNIDRCDRIIDELLDFTRITELNKNPTHIDEWLESLIAEQVIPDGIELEKNFSLKGVIVDVDTERLRRAIINIFENACHSMMDDNQKLVKNKNAILIIKTITDENKIDISVTDTGSGIAEDVLNKVFEPLFSTKGFGVGLGMPVVKQIIEQHGGGIDIKSKEGEGTTVTLWLPIKSTEYNKKVGL